MSACGALTPAGNTTISTGPSTAGRIADQVDPLGVRLPSSGKAIQDGVNEGGVVGNRFDADRLILRYHILRNGAACGIVVPNLSQPIGEDGDKSILLATSPRCVAAAMLAPSPPKP